MIGPKISLVLDAVFVAEDVASVVVVSARVVVAADVVEVVDVAVNASRSEVDASQRSKSPETPSSGHVVCSGQQYASPLSLSH